jgi:Fic family protein
MNDTDSLYAMEPILPPEGDGELSDLAFDLIQRSSLLSAPLSAPVQQELGRLVRSMNCYYSNLIEGHQTHPRDIERALARDFEVAGRQRDLQLEAFAHINVQTSIDAHQDPPDTWPISEAYVRWLHRSFCEQLPKSLLRVKSEDSDRIVDVIPGEYRVDSVRVGRHIPPAPHVLGPFMARFNDAYSPRRLPKVQQLLSAAAAHHRLLWIHPFVDGNGRVARLMSHSLLLRLGVGSSLWSVSRGLARNVERYKAALAGADASRRNDLDGRGSLSLEGLREFCRFFLEVCIDQVQFMRQLLQPAEIVRRIELYVDDEVGARRLPKGSFEMLREVFYQGEVARGRAPEITGYEERRARETVSVLLEKGLLLSKGPRAPVTLGFPIDVLERWLPTLYPVDIPRAPE